MSTYKENHDSTNTDASLLMQEFPMYGSSRLGVHTVGDSLSRTRYTSSTFDAYGFYTSAYENVPIIEADTNTYEYVPLYKQYELSNHLGNVLATISAKPILVDSSQNGMVDNRKADITSVSDYYPFGSLMPERHWQSGGYRFGFNGKERDNEGMGGGGSTYDYGFRIYNGQIGKFLSVDPLTKSYPWYTPYQFAGNKPIIAIDLDGLEEYIIISVYQNNALIGYQYIHVPTSLRIQKEANSPEKYNGVAYFRHDVPNNFIIDYQVGLFPLTLIGNANSFLRNKRDLTFSDDLSQEHNEFLNNAFTRHPDKYKGFNTLISTTTEFYDYYEAQLSLIRPRTSPIYFDNNSFEIKDEFQNELNRLGEYMLNIPSSNYQISAFTDNVGSIESNITLSQQRAQAAVDYLINNYGIDAARLSAKGYGENHPIGDNTTDSGRAQNRRVEFKQIP